MVDETIEQTYVLSLKLNESSFERLDALRRKHFPPERNFLPAHLTLFHKLDEHCVRALLVKVFQLSGLPRSADLNVQLPESPIPLRFSRLRSLGNGVAIEAVSPDLIRLHRALRELFAGHLSAQDEAELAPHVTIQNKVKPEQALNLLKEMAPSFTPWEGWGLGMLVWRYLAGRWEPHAEILFETT